VNRRIGFRLEGDGAESEKVGFASENTSDTGEWQEFFSQAFIHFFMVYGLFAAIRDLVLLIIK
jgi:hypothetical protein